MTAAGATAARRRGAARRQMARGGSVPQLLGVVCCAVLVAAVSRAEAYNSRLVGMSYTSTSNPGGVCLSEKGGFLPNLDSAPRDSEMMTLVIALGYPANIHIPLSGTIGTSACNAAQNCVWRWRGGPYEATPVTFYVGNAANVKQDPALSLYSRWATNFPTSVLNNPRATFFSDTKGWKNTVLSGSVAMFVCEVQEVTTTAAPEESSEPVEVPVSNEASGLPWWIGVVIAVGVAVFVIVLVIIFFRCCRRKTPSDLPVSDEDMNLDEDGMDSDRGDMMCSRKGSAYGRNDDMNMRRQPSFGSGMPRQQSFGGDMQRQQSFGGGMPRQQSFGGDMQRQQSFGGGMPRQQSFGGDMQRQQSFGGGMPRQQSFGGGMGRQQSFGGGMPPPQAFGGGM